MPPRTRRASRPRLTLVLLVLASITIITLDFRGDTKGVIPGIQHIAEDAYSPIRSASDAVVAPIGSFLAGALNAGNLEHENALLRNENGDLKRRILQAEDARRRLAEISALDHLPWTGNIPRVDAEVTEDSTSNFDATITIDKGTASGVADGMPVVAGAGLVGRVVDSWSSGSTVQLLTSAQSDVGVRFGSKGDLALVTGQGKQRALQVDYVAPGTRLRKGEVLFTSGLQNDIFPAGIPVASVASVASSSSATQESVTAVPEAHLAELQYVSILLWEPAS